jgi:hypothetical protein
VASSVCHREPTSRRPVYMLHAGRKGAAGRRRSDTLAPASLQAPDAALPCAAPHSLTDPRRPAGAETWRWPAARDALSGVSLRGDPCDVLVAEPGRLRDHVPCDPRCERSAHRPPQAGLESLLRFRHSTHPCTAPLAARASIPRPTHSPASSFERLRDRQQRYDQHYALPPVAPSARPGRPSVSGSDRPTPHD